jgi:glyoxalase superfamily protein
MSLATYKDLCLDATDARRLAEFWAGGLGLDMVPAGEDSNGDYKLLGPTPQHTVWVNAVPEPKTVKNRVHLDLNVTSLQPLLDLGATVLDGESFPWTVMADPEGGEFCAFVREEGHSRPALYEIIFDSSQGLDQRHWLAEWWAEATGGRSGVEGDEAYVEEVPGAPFEVMVFGQVPEAKTAKNRVHLDLVTPDLDALVASGATVLRARDEQIAWTVMADPDGNELCAFTD